MLDHLDQSLSLEAAAKFVGCSAAYLSRSFSDSEGITIVQFQRTKRIEVATKLLASGTYNVSEAAEIVGYQSLSHFSKAFKQETGILPSEFLDQSESTDS